MNIWFTSNHLCVPKTQGNESRLTTQWAEDFEQVFRIV